MRDPVPPPSQYLVDVVKPFADAFSLHTLPYHVHEVLFALFFYQFVQSILSPKLSTFLFPDVYPKLNRRTRINWDVHVVSLVQSLLINTLALYVMFRDEERYDMKTSVTERVFGYTGISGLVQGLAAGYFLWDLIVSTRYLTIFGIGIWAHAVTALMVFSFGFVSQYMPAGNAGARPYNLLIHFYSDLFATTTGPFLSCMNSPRHSSMCTGSVTS